MDLAQIAEMKNKIVEELRRIEGLKQSMENTLAGLIQWEKLLQSAPAAPVKTTKKKTVVVTEVYPKPQAVIKPADPTPAERVSKALVSIHGEFTRSQLLAETEGDGKGVIGMATYSNIFARLRKKQLIECVKGSPSQRDSLYVKSSGTKPKQAVTP